MPIEDQLPVWGIINRQGEIIGAANAGSMRHPISALPSCANKEMLEGHFNLEVDPLRAEN